MDGLLVIDKPEGWTSHDVVAKVRRILKTKRVGHTGTLDPFATGVLVLLVGKATRLAQFLDRDEKEYEALAQFGYETDTGDRTGKPKTDAADPKPVDIAELAKVLTEFVGEIKQVPPMYSAKKQAGKKLYELARQGKEVERQPVKITIKELELVDTPEIRNSRFDVRIRVVCSAGTYIRTLAEDIGRRLGSGAHLKELRRTRAGRFDITQSISMDTLESSSELGTLLLPIEATVAHLPPVAIPDDRIAKTRNGLASRVNGTPLLPGAAVQMIDSNNKLVAIGVYSEGKNEIKPKIVIS